MLRIPLITAALAVGWSAPARAQAPPNVVLILADDLGVDMLGLYQEAGVPPAGDYPATPNIDALAQRGVTFRHAYSNPLCSTTRATILTGRYAFRNTVGQLVTRPAGGHDLPLCEVTIPDVLSSYGYASAAIGKWHLSDGGHVSPGYSCCGPEAGPIDHGFDYFAGALYNFNSGYFNWERVEHVPPADPTTASTTKYATRLNVTDATRWIDAQFALENPWFLYLPFNAPHVPLQVPPDALHSQTGLPPEGTSYDPNANPPHPPQRVFYKAMIEAVDHQVGRLVGHLDTLGIGENTWIIFLGDNGSTYKLDYADLPATACGNPPPSPLPPGGPQGKRSYYEGGINVPLIVAGPTGWVDNPGRIEESALVNTTDMLATVCDMTSTPLPSVTLDSVSVLPVVMDETQTVARTFAYAEMFAHCCTLPTSVLPAQAIRNDRYKLIHNEHWWVWNEPAQQCDEFPESYEAYDLLTDPCELNNIWQDPTLSQAAADSIRSLYLKLIALRATPDRCVSGFVIPADEPDNPCWPPCPDPNPAPPVCPGP